MRKPLLVLARIAAFLFTIGTIAIAQMTTATLSGMVTDETAAVLPGVEVAVVNRETGNRRAVTTDAEGRFVLSQLAPGPYEVIATISGFDTLRRSGITLVIGQDATVNMVMKVGTVTQQVEVTGEASLVDTSSSAVSGVVDQQRIEEMPLNGRDFSQLALVQPGVTGFRNGDVTVTKGWGTRISMGGSRPDQTLWLLDGTTLNSPTNFGTPGSAAGLMLGVDAVREFQVLTSNYSAEFGGTSGGVVNMLTKSGTNRLHGTAYEYFRNSVLDSRSFFDVQKPPFKRNQFGASIGGPIKKDKTFFFSNYEGVRQRLGATNVAVVPDANAHQGLLPAPGGGLQQVAVAPEVLPFLNVLPLPNGPELGAGTATLYSPVSDPANENYFIVRVDHHLTDKQSVFARFTYDQGNFGTPDQVPLFETLANTGARYAALEHDYVVSPRFLLNTLAAYNRTPVSSDEIPLANLPTSLNILKPGYMPQITLPGETAFGVFFLNVSRRVRNLYQFQESAQYIHGSHSMKFGASIEHVGDNKCCETAAINGTFTWPTLQAFLLDSAPNSFTGVATGSDVYRSFVQYYYGAYIQDDWKMLPNFTWNFGLRYEPYTAPTEKHGKEPMVKDWVTATEMQTNIGLFKSPADKYFAPRVGFAWDPKGDGKTAVRAAFGIFYVPIASAALTQPGSKNPPYFGTTSLVVGNLLTAPAAMAQLSPTLLNPVLNPSDSISIDPWNMKPMYNMKFNFTMERQLPGDMSLSVGYAGDRGIHLWRLGSINYRPPIIVNGRPFVVPGTPLVNPHFGVSATHDDSAQSFYNGLQVQLKKRFSHGFQFQSSYTWSKNIDDSTSGVGPTDYNQTATSQPYNPKADRGLSGLNVGQSLAINGIYDLPSPGSRGFAPALLGGWQLASIFTINSGTPFTVYLNGNNALDSTSNGGATQHPDLVAGHSFSGIVTGNPNQYFDRTAFVLPPAGFYGNAGRDILIGPSLVNLDFSVVKRTRLPIREGSTLEFHADCFNIFNHANLQVPRPTQSAVINTATGAYIAGAGKITGTVSSARQLQFGLKLIF